MSGREVTRVAAQDNGDDDRNQLPDLSGGLPVDADLVDSADPSYSRYFGHFRVSPVDRATLVKMVRKTESTDAGINNQGADHAV